MATRRGHVALPEWLEATTWLRLATRGLPSGGGRLGHAESGRGKAAAAPEVGGGGCGLGGAEKEEEGVGCQNWKGKVYIKGRD